jgi:replicative DNA helicase
MTPEVSAEQATLGAVLLAPEAFPDVRGILALDDFDAPANRAVFRGMESLASRGIPIDVVTLTDELTSVGDQLQLEGGIQSYLLQMAHGAPVAANVSHYTGIVAKHAALRRLRLVAAEIADVAADSPDEAQRLVLEAQRLVTQVARGRTRPGVDVATLVQPALDEFEARVQAGKGLRRVGLTTGLGSLDYMMGGFRRGSLNIIGARTSLGKTAFACQIALVNAIKHGIPALVFSLEMTPGELVERFFSRWARIDSAKLRKGELNIADWHALHAAGNALSQPGMVTISNTRTVAGIMSEARGFRVRHPDRDILVLVDYLQIVRSGERGRTREQEVADVSSALKEIAVDLNCPVVSPAQLNRGPEQEERDPRVSDLRESGAIENDADTIMFIVRKRGDASGACWVPVIKNRNGATGEIQVSWNGPTYELRDIEDTTTGGLH